MISTCPRVVCGALFLHLLATPVLADGDSAGDAAVEAPEYPELSGNIALGLFRASGNTESNSVQFDIEAEVDYEKWRHTLTLNRYHASEDGEESAERYGGRLQLDYRITDRAYLFAVGRYERDRFGAFDRRASLAFGIGRRFIETENVELDLEAGAGRRGAEPNGTNERDYDTIDVLRGDFVWRLSEVSEFRQELEVESGDENTSTQTVSAIRSKFAGNLSWVLSYTIEHNSDVPAGTEKTDRFTAVSLQYGY